MSTSSRLVFGLAGMLDLDRANADGVGALDQVPVGCGRGVVLAVEDHRLDGRGAFRSGDLPLGDGGVLEKRRALRVVPIPILREDGDADIQPAVFIYAGHRSATARRLPPNNPLACWQYVRGSGDAGGDPAQRLAPIDRCHGSDLVAEDGDVLHAGFYPVERLGGRYLR